MQSRLEAYITEKGLNQASFGERLGVSAAAVSRYAAGERQPRRKIAERMRDLTCGAIHAGNCSDQITDAEAAEMMAEIARREEAAKAGEVARG